MKEKVFHFVFKAMRFCFAGYYFFVMKDAGDHFKPEPGNDVNINILSEKPLLYTALDIFFNGIEQELLFEFFKLRWTNLGSHSIIFHRYE